MYSLFLPALCCLALVYPPASTLTYSPPGPPLSSDTGLLPVLDGAMILRVFTCCSVCLEHQPLLPSLQILAEIELLQKTPLALCFSYLAL